MSTKRKRYSAELKAKVAVEAIRGVKTTAELSSAHQVHPTLISQWKRQALEHLASLFEGGSTGSEPDVAAVSAPLYAQIGRLQVEPDWRKTKAEGSVAAQRLLIEPGHVQLSLARQCQLLGLARSR